MSVPLSLDPVGAGSAPRPAEKSGRPREALVVAALCLTSLLPNLGAALPLQTYYFRDFTVAFYPLRVFAARELAAGRWPFWNPYIHEGSFALPDFYPLDLLHALWSGPVAVSWLLTIHFPIAALAAYALARALGARPGGAFVTGAVFSLGGLALSTLNLYVFLQALALAPLVILMLRQAALRAGRNILFAALVLAISLSTLALEFVAQAVLLGIALGLVARPGLKGAGRIALALAVGAGLAMVPLAVTAGILSESVRGLGFVREVALGNELHPVALVQTLVPDLFGSLKAPAEVWWGARFFSKGFPYFLSLYLGPLVFCLAAAGVAALSRSVRYVLLGGTVLALWYALGERGGLAWLTAALPFMRWVRFPVKLLLTPYLVTALLAGLGADRLRTRQGWTTLAGAAAILAGGLFGVGVAALAAPAALAGPTAPRALVRVLVGRDVIVGLLLVSTAALLSRSVRARRVPAGRAVALLAVLLVLDLARAGSGMNPQAPAAYFAPLPELARERLHDLHGGRVFSFGLDESPAFRRFLGRGGPGIGLWSFFVSRQALAPYANILDRVETAEGKDLTSFIPHAATVRPEEHDPSAVAAILGRLRSASVTRVLSLDPLSHPDLFPRSAFPAGPKDLTIHVYELSPSWPRSYVACRTLRVPTAEAALAASLGPAFDPRRDVVFEQAGDADCRNGEVALLESSPGNASYEARSDGAGYLVVRESFARGWKATVDGRLEPVLRANGKHQAIRLPAGIHQVRRWYEPPRLTVALIVSAIAAVLTLALLLRPLPVAAYPG